MLSAYLIPVPLGKPRRSTLRNPLPLGGVPNLPADARSWVYFCCRFLFGEFLCLRRPLKSVLILPS